MLCACYFFFLVVILRNANKELTIKGDILPGASGSVQLIINGIFHNYGTSLTVSGLGVSGYPISIIGQPTPTLSCTDSDGGKNLEVAGLTDGRVNGIGSYFNDQSVASNGGQCTGSNCTSVAEGYCENGKVTNYLFACPSGLSVNGACVQNTIPTVPAIQPSVTVLSPNGGQRYTKGLTQNTGDTLSFSVSIANARNGNDAVYITERNDSSWRSGYFASQGGADGVDATVTNPYVFSGSTQLNQNARAGNYYLLVEWTDSSGQVYRDFSDSYFTILDPAPVVDTARLNTITSYYKSLLARTPDDAGLNYFLNSSMSLDQIKATIMGSAEYSARRQNIRQLYLDFLKREPDTQGWDYFSNNGLTLDQIKQAIIASQEYLNLQSTTSSSSASQAGAALVPMEDVIRLIKALTQ